jgi:hypothetical protein
VRTAKVCVAEVRPIEERPLEPPTPKARLLEVRPTQVHILEIYFAQIHPGKLGVSEIQFHVTM